MQQTRQQIPNTYPTRYKFNICILNTYRNSSHSASGLSTVVWIEPWCRTHLHSDYYVLFIYKDYITHTGVTDIAIRLWVFMVH